MALGKIVTQIFVGIIVTVIGGLILATILGNPKGSYSETETTSTPEVINPINTPSPTISETTESLERNKIITTPNESRKEIITIPTLPVEPTKPEKTITIESSKSCVDSLDMMLDCSL